MPERLRKTTHRGHNLSVAERVLIATAEAANWTTKPVPYGAIVVCAWRAFPEQFGLPGHPEYPDSSDVHKRLYGPLKSGELVESLGNKTFRVTERGMAEARATMARLPESLPSKPTIDIEVHQGQTTQSIIEAMLDVADSQAGTVAERLLAAVLAMRFPDWERPVTDGHLVVGDTTFTVLLPATLERMQLWLREDVQGFRPRLLVRDDVLPAARGIIEDTERSTAKAVFGIESFIAQMIEGIATYDEQRILESWDSLIRRYNQELPESMPRIQLNSVIRDN